MLNLSVLHTSTTATAYSNVLQLFISLTLLVVSKIHQRNDLVGNNEASNLLLRLQKFICNWISCPSIIGDSYFGGNDWKGQKELEVWHLI